MYRRVIPRDLFNEAKLLKCMGRLSLLIHDGMCDKWRLTLDHDGGSFRIHQNEADGGIFVNNLGLRVIGGPTIYTQTGLNSRREWPLTFEGQDGESGDVFGEDGSLSDEFCAYLDSLLTQPGVIR